MKGGARPRIPEPLERIRDVEQVRRWRRWTYANIPSVSNLPPRMFSDVEWPRYPSMSEA